MEILIALSLVACGSPPESPNALDVGVGTVIAPAGFHATHHVATDVTVGTITRGELAISFSIGAMGGTQMHAARQSECSWFDIQSGEDLTLRYAGVLGDGSLVVTVIPAPFPGAIFPGSGYPANFSANVRTEAERAEVLAIAASYRPSDAAMNYQIWIPRGIERRADAAAPGSGSHPALSMEQDPFVVQPTLGRALGTHATWLQRGPDGVFQLVLSADQCGVHLHDLLGPPGVPEHDLRVDLVIFETSAPCGTAWTAFSDPSGAGYRELHRASVPHDR